MLFKCLKYFIAVIIAFILIGSTFYSTLYNDSLQTWINSDPIYKIKDASLFDIKNDKWVEETLSDMTLEEKVGQLIVPFVYGRYYSEDDAAYQRLEHLIKNLHVGGFIFFNGEIYEQAILTNKIQQLSKVPLLISADYESGVAQRSKSSTLFPTNMALAAGGDTNLIFKMGEIIGKESRAIGVHQNYAPVVDINNNPGNPIINTRSFGDDKYLVTKYGNLLIKGIQKWNMLATSKHFPGHGNTTVDSHSDLAIINLSREQLADFELYPFKENIKNGLLSVMIGHLGIPAFDSVSNLPATLSKNIVTKLLRNQMKFKGLIVTDAMNMRAITNYYSTAEAAVLAIEAGNDILLFPNDEDEAYGALVFAVQSGQLKESRIEESVRRILLAKRWAGLDKNRFVDIDKIAERVGVDEHWAVSHLLAQKAITLVKNEQNLIPLNYSFDKKYFHIALTDNNRTTSAENFDSYLKQRIPELSSAVLTVKTTAKMFNKTKEDVLKSDVIILSAFTKVRDGQGTIGLSKEQEKFANSLINSNKKIIFLAHGNPYVLSSFSKVKTYLCNYGDSDILERALAEAVFGENDIQGKLPVSIPGTKYKSGFGLSIIKSSIKDDIIAETDNNINRFGGVDQMIRDAIRDTVFPGACLLVAKDGKILYEKSFGRLTYSRSSSEVTSGTIYDIASLTKVIATTTAVMLCIDKGLFNLDDKVSEYIPEFGVNGKEAITIRNLLLHNSGLSAFKPYYKEFNSANEVINSIYSSSLDYPLGSKMVYSDLGFITLAKIVEKVTKKSFDVFCTEEIFKPLGMKDTKFNPNKSNLTKIAPTELDTYWRNRLVHGTVHDETAALLNGVAGHAGLFSTAKDISHLLQMLLQNGFYQGRQIVKKETVELFTKKQSAQSTRALGWDTKDEKGSSAGKLFSVLSFGHTGFTGTSVWVDPSRDLFVVLLTNRVYPTRENRKLIPFRGRLHDAVINALENTNGK